MCGRFAIKALPEDMLRTFGYAERPNFPPRYNIAPTQPVPVVTMLQGQRHFQLMRWGFIPGWVKDMKDFPLIFNIRSEGAREKASFRAAFLRRRALMPADAFYEWRREGRASHPFMVRRPDQGLFAFPALWETWMSADGSEVDTVALLTAAAEGPMAAIHHRMPVILDPANWNEWLDPDTTPERAETLLTPPLQTEMELVALGPAINKVSNDGREVQEPAGEPQAQPPSKPKKPPVRAAEDDGQGSLF